MYHSITFYDPGNNSSHKNTWTDWYLIPTKRPTIAQPGTVTKYVDIPGRDGSYDISEYLMGRPTYTDRTGSLEFYVSNDKPVTWRSILDDMTSFLHNKKIKMVIDDDNQWYYLGRFTVKEWKPEPNFSQVIIEYRLSPYKTNSTSGVTSL